MLNECIRRCGCNDDHASWKRKHHGACWVSAEEAVVTERLALVEAGERKETCVPEDSDGALESLRFVPDPCQAVQRDDPQNPGSTVDRQRLSLWSQQVGSI